MKIINKIKDLIYEVNVEMNNELDYGYESNVVKRQLTDEDFDLMEEYLDRAFNKLKLVIEDFGDDIENG